jgi:hypothetical protein
VGGPGNRLEWELVTFQIRHWIYFFAQREDGGKIAIDVELGKCNALEGKEGKQGGKEVTKERRGMGGKGAKRRNERTKEEGTRRKEASWMEERQELCCCCLI